MKRTQARIIADTITNGQLKAMFEKAKTQITDWTRPSVCNAAISKGKAWNILAADFDEKVDYPYISKVNMIREFGDFLPWELRKPPTKKSLEKKEPIHEQPKF